VLTPISAIASQAAKPTKDTLAQTQQLLDYASQVDAELTYNCSKVILAAHSNASYLSKPQLVAVPEATSSCPTMLKYLPTMAPSSTMPK
jgi:hypothetical protein